MDRTEVFKRVNQECGEMEGWAGFDMGHTIETYLTYTRIELIKAITEIAHGENEPRSLPHIRKVAALCILCLQRHDKEEEKEKEEGI